MALPPKINWNKPGNSGAKKAVRQAIIRKTILHKSLSLPLPSSK